MSVDVKYKTSATAIGGRDGSTHTEDGRIDLQLAVPRELGGQGGEGTNPQQLFAEDYAASFLGAVKVAGGQLKVSIPQILLSQLRSASDHARKVNRNHC